MGHFLALILIWTVVYWRNESCNDDRPYTEGTDDCANNVPVWRDFSAAKCRRIVFEYDGSACRWGDDASLVIFVFKNVAV